MTWYVFGVSGFIRRVGVGVHHHHHSTSPLQKVGQQSKETNAVNLNNDMGWEGSNWVQLKWQTEIMNVIYLSFVSCYNKKKNSFQNKSYVSTHPSTKKPRCLFILGWVGEQKFGWLGRFFGLPGLSSFRPVWEGCPQIHVLGDFLVHVEEVHLVIMNFVNDFFYFWDHCRQGDSVFRRNCSRPE